MYEYGSSCGYMVAILANIGVIFVYNRGYLAVYAGIFACDAVKYLILRVTSKKTKQNSIPPFPHTLPHFTPLLYTYIVYALFSAISKRK